MADMMCFPDSWEDFEKSFGFTDNKEIYTNGSRLIQSFRVKQWLEHIGKEPIVRCKYCKHYQNGHICRYFSRFGTIETNPNGYCSWGEYNSNITQKNSNASYQQVKNR